MKLVTANQMRALEQAAVAAGATWPGLMEHAGWGVAQEALRLLGDPQGKAVLVLVGPGNNGGDGLVVARHLHDSGARVTLYLWRRAAPDADRNWQACRERGISEYTIAQDPGLEHLAALLAGCALVVDALLGIGVARPVEGQLAALIERVNNHTALASHVSARPLVLAVDVPTGVDGDNGRVLGAALKADLTVATGLGKRGLWLYPGRAYVGTTAVADIGVPARGTEEAMTETLGAEYARAVLPARSADSHKGTYGKALVVAGSLRYPGAALLATSACVRAGAGLVTLACARALYPVLAARVPEATMLPLPEADWGTLGEEAAGELFENLADYRALLIGPGLGQEEATGKLLARLLGVDAAKKRSSVGFVPRTASGAGSGASEGRVALPPLVVDADGLNLLAKIEHWWERLGDARMVLTPHPGEMARLLGVEALDDDRAQAAQQAAQQWGQVVVLKGASSIVAAPDGRLLIDEHPGNPALATAGTGDVLAGLITGLLAQGLEPFDAAALGVYLHSAAGALLRDEMGDAGTAAPDLLPRIPLAIKALR
jgi:ADP-dependent NAD(P)H-hydrate dehydratase / NAD(P)H-hydrate epimerase